jgi:hypothetical protein
VVPEGTWQKSSFINTDGKGTWTRTCIGRSTDTYSVPETCCEYRNISKCVGNDTAQSLEEALDRRNEYFRMLYVQQHCYALDEIEKNKSAEKNIRN